MENLGLAMELETASFYQTQIYPKLGNVKASLLWSFRASHALNYPQISHIPLDY